MNYEQGVQVIQNLPLQPSIYAEILGTAHRIWFEANGESCILVDEGKNQEQFDQWIFDTVWAVGKHKSDTHEWQMAQKLLLEYIG